MNGHIIYKNGKDGLSVAPTIGGHLQELPSEAEELAWLEQILRDEILNNFKSQLVLINDKGVFVIDGIKVEVTKLKQIVGRDQLKHVDPKKLEERK